MRLTCFFAAIFCAGMAGADAPRVAVDIAPLHSLVAQVMDGVGTPDLIVRPGATPHHYALRPSEAAALSQADLVIWMGEGLTPWLAGSLDKLAGEARRVTMLEAEETQLLPLREEIAFTHDDDGHDDHDHDHDHDHDDGVDPHAWLSLENAQRWTVLIAEELAALDSGNAGKYRANAEKAVEALQTLKGEIVQTVEPLKGTSLLVFHDAYHYFEHEFDLHAAAAVALSDASRPGPARIAALRDMADEHQISCVLTEPQFDPKLIHVVLSGGFKTGMVDPMGAAIVPGPGHYGTMMRALAAGFASCAD